MKHRPSILASVVILAVLVLAFAAHSATASQRPSSSIAASDIPVLVSFSVTPMSVKINRINLLKITFQYRDDGLNLKGGYLIWGLHYIRDTVIPRPFHSPGPLLPDRGSSHLPCGGLPTFFSYPFLTSAFAKASGSFTFYVNILAENCDYVSFQDMRLYDKPRKGSNYWPDIDIPRDPSPSGEVQGNKVGQIAYDFTLFDKSNRRLTLSNYRGKVVLIDFSTMWCPACKDEGQHLEQLYQAYKNQGLIVISAISQADDGNLALPADLRLWASRNRMTFPVVADPLYFVQRFFYGTAQTVQIPYNVIIDRQGRIALKVIGYDAARHTKIENKIKSLL